MLIVVQYLDETFDMVIHYRLNELLDAGVIKGFSSCDGWIKIDHPPTKRLYDIINLD